MFKQELKYTNILYYLLLVIIAMGALWQVAFFQNSVKWDFIEVVFPWRFYVGECLQANTFPLWNPYQQLGYPMFADLQYPWWYLEQLVIGFLFGYNNYIMQLLLVGYVWLAGVGMFKLSNCFVGHRPASFIIACSYMLSGYFIGHAQSLTLIIGGAFLPFVLYYYIHLLESPNLKTTLKLSVFLFLLISGGYQALTIILAYLLLILFISKWWCERKNKLFLVELLKAHGLLFAIIILESLCLFVIVFQLHGQTNRLFGGTVDFVNELPFTPQSMLSFILPNATVENLHFFNTDLSLTNGYMGIITLVFTLYSILFLPKTKTEIILLVFGLLSLLAAFGNYTPVRTWLYYIPMFNTFRFTGIFRLFTIIIFLLLAGKSIKLFFENGIAGKKMISQVALVASVLVGFLVYSCFIHNSELLVFKGNIIKQSLVQLSILLVSIVLIAKRKPTLLTIVCVVDLLIATQLNSPYTVFSETTPKEIHSTIGENSEAFSTPSATPIIKNSDAKASMNGIGRNCNLFKKEISYDGYSSFWLANYDKFYYENPNLRRAVLQNPFIYFSSNLLPISQLSSDTSTLIQTSTIFVPDSVYAHYKNSALRTDSADYINVLSFLPNQIQVEVSTKNTQLLNLLQSNFPGWEVTIDGKPVNHFSGNILFISTVVPSGKHSITYTFNNTIFISALAISYGVFLTVLLCLIWLVLKESKYKHYILLSFICSTIAIFMIVYYTHKTTSLTPQELTSFIKEKSKSYPILLNTDKNNQLQLQLRNSYDVRYTNSCDINKFAQFLAKNNSDTCLYVQHNTARAANLNLYLQENFMLLQSHKIENGELVLLVRKKIKSEFLAYADFESGQSNWSIDSLALDTNVYFTKQHSYSYIPTREWGICYTIEGKQLETVSKKKFLTIALKYKGPNTNRALVAISVQNGEHILKWEKRFLSDFHSSETEWNQLFWASEISSIYPQEANKILIYVWNIEKETFWVDDMSINAH
ncbi:MAG: hypothetical protein J0M08_00965 [Bacteroidetes bacterium]|nr:hypothetical protein [Bacteroidota bacterium]